MAPCADSNESAGGSALAAPLRLRRPLAKQGSADPNMGGAFSHRGFQVIGHAHRKCIQPVPARIGVIEELAQLCENGPLFFGIGHGPRNQHESAHTNARQLFQLLKGWQYFFFIKSGFRLLGLQVQLQTDVQGRKIRGSLMTEALGNFGAAHAVRPGKILRDVFGLVALYGADKVPFNSAVSERSLLVQSFLNKVFRKVALPQVVQYPKLVSGVQLADGHQFHCPAGAAVLHLCSRDASADGFEIRCEAGHY